MKLAYPLIFFLLCQASAVFADKTHHSKYAGEETRQIKSLSADDIAQLQKGAGWGLAKAAELNGVPGPAHLLEMAKEINLSAKQKKQIQVLYNEMKNAAIPLGKRLIELEAGLNTRFADKTLTDTAQLKALLDEIGRVRTDLRFTHLAAHLKTPAILSPQQISLYNQLRGYGAGAPCQQIPQGHDPRMWRKHNGCKP